MTWDDLWDTMNGHRCNFLIQCVDFTCILMLAIVQNGARPKAFQLSHINLGRYTYPVYLMEIGDVAKLT